MATLKSPTRPFNYFFLIHQLPGKSPIRMPQMVSCIRDTKALGFVVCGDFPFLVQEDIEDMVSESHCSLVQDGLFTYWVLSRDFLERYSPYFNAPDAWVMGLNSLPIKSMAGLTDWVKGSFPFAINHVDAAVWEIFEFERKLSATFGFPFRSTKLEGVPLHFPFDLGRNSRNDSG